jgi:peptidyl-tRNA hydrolase
MSALKLSAQYCHAAIYIIKLATTHLIMPVLRRVHKRGPALILLRLEVGLRLDQCAGDLLEMV